MSRAPGRRGGAPVAIIGDLEPIEAACVLYFRLWNDGPAAQALVWEDLAAGLGAKRARRAIDAFEALCDLCARHGRRPLIRHSLQCRCIGADECSLATFIATAAEGEREDALLIATLLVRPDVAPLLASVAAEFGLALMRMGHGPSLGSAIMGHRPGPVH